MAEGWRRGVICKHFASRGAILRRLGTPTDTVGVAFDGANVWVALANAASVAKL
jgi:hypothetical protein